MLAILIAIAAACLLDRSALQEKVPDPVFRAPAVPLVTHDPYFSAWSFADRLTDDWPKHWTGKNFGMCGMVRVDSQVFRVIGAAPREVPPMPQKSVAITPTHTDYVFETNSVRVELSFLSPLLLDDFDLCSRPVTYLTWNVRSIDERMHDVELYLDASAEWCVNTNDQQVEWGRYEIGGPPGSLSVMRIGARDQRPLTRAGDDLRIDWGHLYLARPQILDKVGPTLGAMCSDLTARGGFEKGNFASLGDDLDMPRAAWDRWAVLAFATPKKAVGATPLRFQALLAYDDGYSIEYFGRKLRPYWRREGKGIAELLSEANVNYPAIESRCRAFDAELTKDLRAVGGEDFARLAILSYRQAIAANKIAADFDGSPLMFPKENFSNGCISTVDVIYPAAPIFLLLSPKALRAQLEPVFAYARSSRWRFPFAPHDLGTYPLANGQVYGGGERTEEDQMPVEESANLLLLAAALAEAEGNPTFAEANFPLLTKWAEYLREHGLDPENQLCTDDFAGHLAHNTNLSIKAILGIAAHAKLCDATQRKTQAESWRSLAATMAKDWLKRADDGDHTRLAFDKPGTWSQKYNLAWDKVLGLGVFPAELTRRELAFYRAKMNPFGLPLDNRATYTKLDWCLWTATLADSPEEIAAFAAPLALFAAKTPDRLPLTDWLETKDPRCVGFRARSVVGGVFMPALTHADLTAKYRARAR
jgi:hypothetical protein